MWGWKMKCVDIFIAWWSRPNVKTVFYEIDAMKRVRIRKLQTFAFNNIQEKIAISQWSTK
jgi:hypothetical protein